MWLDVWLQLAIAGCDIMSCGAGLNSSCKTCTYTYQLVQIRESSPTKLVVMSDRRHRSFLCVSQVFNSFLTGVCSYSAFYRACTSSSKHILQSGPDKDLLVKLGGLDVCAPHATLVTLAACYKALQKLSTKLPSEVLAAFKTLKDSPGSLMVLGLPAHVLAPCTQPSTVPQELQMVTPFPTTLPVFPLPANHKSRYGLMARHKQHLISRAPLSQQLRALKSWCTNGFQLDRPGAAYSSSTWDNLHKDVLGFLGYCHEFHQVSLPTLQLYLLTPLIAHHVSFHVTAKHSPLTVRNFLSTARMVLRWWQTQPGGNHPSFDQGIQWLKRLNIQVQAVARPLHHSCCCYLLT